MTRFAPFGWTVRDSAVLLWTAIITYVVSMVLVPA